MIVVLLLPIWSVRYIPTIDGPSHLYNAWILRQYDNTAEYPLFQQYYKIDWRPIPNWLSHAVLALLMLVLPPGLAEKVLLSGHVILFAAAARYLAGAVDPERRWLGVLALPFCYNMLLQIGFYNFCLSLSFCLLAVGLWWRHRARPGLRLALPLNLLLLLCWFSHIVSLCLALASIGILWLITLRGEPWRRHLLHLPILAPQVILPLWFVQSHGGGPVPSPWDTATHWRYLLQLKVLHWLADEQLVIGIALAVVFGLLVLLTLAGKVRRRELGREDGFLLLSLFAVALYFSSPEGMSGGSLLKIRLSLYPWLLLIPWLAPGIGRRGRAAVLTLVASLTVFQAGMLVYRYRQLQPEIRQFLAATEAIAPDSRVLPLLFTHFTTSPAVNVLGHALDHAAADRGLLAWGNYEAVSWLFPVRYRPEAGQVDLYTLEAQPDKVDIQSYKDRTDYVFTWKMDPGSPFARQLRRDFRLVAVEGPGRVYVRRAGRPPAPRRSRPRRHVDPGPGTAPVADPAVKAPGGVR